MRISLISVALASALLLTSCSASAAATSSVTETAATTTTAATTEATTTSAETTPRVTKINSTYLDVDKALFLAVPAGFETDACAPFPYSDEMVTPGEQYEGAYPNYAFALKDGTTVSYVVVEFKPDSETFKNLTVGSKVKFSYTNEEGYKSTSLGVVLIEANGAKLALYRCPFTDNGSKQTGGTKGRYWTATTDYGNIIYSPDSGNYWNRAVQIRVDEGDNYVNNKSWIWDGLSIRAILNE